MPRLFFGLEIPEAIKTSLLQVKTQVAGARWQSRGQLHLTLAFLGQVEDHQVALACDLARGITQSSFELNVQGLGCFGSPEKPKILWAGVSPENELRDLQNNLATRLTANGFTLENPNFKPHITLSRFRHPAGSVSSLLDSHQGTVFGLMPVQDFVLYESAPGPGGSIYNVIERFTLQP
ncbi:RNA 2',3'-cyclic phosphodiesterase [Marinobacter sp. LQ44]|uniref:RNA 2',3'-cyclic phosphodiesterase n=1 Tax=unclassified Marinobacter TaxID=83889 RepID=UPI000718E21C|nr:RNA 2',3'-cyclic phosphodiesterase [Marinobacter sp. LQ44]AMQ88255.1 2'-5' RNA ligase [Marinobacter sp. LQ44]